MKIKVFLDTNVLLDVLQQGRPFTASSQVILQAIWDRKIEAVLTTQSVVDSAYITGKEGLQQTFFNMVNRCCDYINMDYINTFDIRLACRNYSGDFEDDVLYFRALDACCDVFVTSDVKLRNRYSGKHELLQFMSPEEFVSKIRGEAIPSQT